ncbi:MAG: NUDIX hydrolase [Bacteroidetes bacterium]|jgi:8-oxo-dGTP pyrophosphatase MutT (NUDIX family)|nr:NUDIX hydrolase [Bacteroidota bacterium]
MSTPPEEKNPWQTLSSRVAYENPWIQLTEHQVLNPAGKPGIYGTVHFKNLAIGIIPLDAAGYTWLVGQYRYPLGQYSWEIPEGGGPMGISPEESARRELKEETGLEAQNLQLLVTTHLSNSVSDEVGYVYLATGLTEGSWAPEETEVLQLRRLPFEEAYQMVLRAEITDSLAVAGILRLKLLLLEGSLRL